MRLRNLAFKSATTPLYPCHSANSRTTANSSLPTSAVSWDKSRSIMSVMCVKSHRGMSETATAAGCQTPPRAKSWGESRRPTAQTHAADAHLLPHEPLEPLQHGQPKHAHVFGPDNQHGHPGFLQGSALLAPHLHELRPLLCRHRDSRGVPAVVGAAGDVVRGHGAGWPSSCSTHHRPPLTPVKDHNTRAARARKTHLNAVRGLKCGRLGF